MLGGDIFILEPVGVLLGGEEHIVGCPIHSQLRAGGAGKPVEMGGDGVFNPGGIGAELLQEGMKDAFLFRQQRTKQVDRHQLRVAPLLCQFLSPNDGFLCFNRVFIKSHKWPPTLGGGMTDFMPTISHKGKTWATANPWDAGILKVKKRRDFAIDSRR